MAMTVRDVEDLRQGVEDAGLEAEAVAAGRDVDDATRAFAAEAGVHVVAERNVEAA